VNDRQRVQLHSWTIDTNAVNVKYNTAAEMTLNETELTFDIIDRQVSVHELDECAEGRSP